MGTVTIDNYDELKGYLGSRKLVGVELDEGSKEAFRQMLLASVPERDVLLNKSRMEERDELARTYRVPDSVFAETSELYARIAETITRKPVPKIVDPKAEILDSLAPWGILD